MRYKNKNILDTFTIITNHLDNKLFVEIIYKIKQDFSLSLSLSLSLLHKHTRTHARTHTRTHTHKIEMILQVNNSY